MILNSRNTSVNPCDDFYEHSCGNWIATHEISPRDNAAGVFLSLRDILDERLRDLLEGTYEDILTSIKQAKTLFHSCDDIYSIEQLNIANVITNTFNRYTDNDMIKLLSLYGGRGLAPITVTQDAKNSSIIKIYFSWINPILKRNQTNKDQFQKLVEGFQDLIDVNTVINMETKILNMTYLNVENEKVTLEDLSNETAANLDAYINDILNEIGSPIKVTKNDSVYVASKDYVKQLFQLIDSSPRNFREYTFFRMLLSLSMALPMKYRKVVEAYENELQSQSYSLSRDIQCAKKVNKLLPNHVGRLYVDKYFKKSTKEKVAKLVEDIRQSMLHIFSGSDWMDEATKDAAKKKAAAVLDFIGYSATINKMPLFPDVGNLTGTDFLTSMLNIRRMTSALQFNSLRNLRPRNSSDIPSALVNAFYDPSRNTIRTTVKSFGMDRKAIDTLASNRTGWRTKVGKRVKVFEKAKAYKTSISKTGEKHQMLPGLEYTDDQLFFAGFAHIWCRRTSRRSILNQLNNEHSPARARVTVTLMNSHEFSKAFKCPPNSRMNPTEKYGVW
ncbi:endothelin-converting enzyme homolog isoform X2 [Octopus vulgaris]|uniref:Endothelin-converting enzyme homolog isoform X2 n=1 Tax=Octopus vulgaris TaxID=6645 RepID=A0AA36BB69_OCTVU|nr:endothelin-converting enzyme homolog isoform X2 [Octopus vulgaris]